MTPSSAGARVFGWTGAALFAASLGYFLYTYGVTFGETAAGTASAADMAMNVALFSMFGLHHSVFARERVRAWVSRRVPPEAERASYVWIASLMLIAVCRFWRPLPGVLWDVSGVAAWLVLLVQVLGLVVTLRAAAMIDVWELAGVNRKSRIPNPKARIQGEAQPPWRFRTDGPYGLVRHPIYLGWYLIVFGVPTMTMTRLMFAAISGLYIVIAIPLEERSLRRLSGGAYDEYVRRVRWRLIPGIY